MARKLKYIWLLLTVCLSGCIIISAQSITLYSFPPPHPIKWRNPHSLLLSTVRNYLSGKNKEYPRRPIGHLLVELKKGSSSIITGMAPDHPSEFKELIFKEKAGLSILFDVVDGHLERTERVKTELNLRTENSKAAFITYHISDSAYEYLRCYIDSFKARGYDNLYNGENEPRMGKGAGCSAFGVSFLELINALQPEYKENWAVQVDIPERLLGETIENKKVSVWKMLFSFSWAKKKEPSRSLMLYDPYLIYKWIKKKWKKENHNSNGIYKAKKINKAKGLEIECKDCEPQVPMFKV